MKIDKRKIIFSFLLLLTLFCALFSTFLFCKTTKPNLINVLIETSVQNKDDILLKIDDRYFIPPQFNNILNQEINKKINSLEILVSENHKNEIKSIILFNDIKMYYYLDFADFEKTKEEICQNDICKKYDKYKFDSEKLIPQKSQISPFIEKLSQFDLVFLPFYLALFSLIIYGSKIRLNKWILPSLIFVFAIVFRLNYIGSYAPWGDECFSILISKTNLPFLSLFDDPGNPPFYFFTLKILQWFTDSVVAFRFLSVLFSLAAGLFLYFFLNKNYTNKMANIALFFYSINLPLIYFSQEIRCYSLQVLLAVLILIYTFKIIEKSKTKNWIIYAILIMIAINTHYYQLFFVLANFLYLTFIFLKNGRTRDFIYLLIANFIALCTFLPYYFLTAHKEAYLNSGFNTYLPEITFDLIKKCCYFIFGGLISFLVSIAFFFKRVDCKKRELLFYCYWIIFAVIIFGLIMSFIIRPMFVERYVAFLIPFVLIILALIFSFEYKNKWIFFLIIPFVFVAQNYAKDSFVNLRYVTMQSHNTFDMAKKTKSSDKHVVLISKASDSAVMRYYKYDDIELITLPKYNSFEILNAKIKEVKNKYKNVTIFTPLLENNSKNAQNKNYTCYFNSSRDLCIWKIE